MKNVISLINKIEPPWYDEQNNLRIDISLIARSHNQRKVNCNLLSDKNNMEKLSSHVLSSLGLSGTVSKSEIFLNGRYVRLVINQ